MAAKKTQPAAGLELVSLAPETMGAGSSASEAVPDAEGKNAADEGGEQAAAGHPSVALASPAVLSTLPARPAKQPYEVVLGPIKHESGIARTGDILHLTNTEVRGIGHLLKALPLENP